MSLLFCVYDSLRSSSNIKPSPRKREKGEIDRKIEDKGDQKKKKKKKKTPIPHMLQAQLAFPLFITPVTPVPT